MSSTYINSFFVITVVNIHTEENSENMDNLEHKQIMYFKMVLKPIFEIVFKYGSGQSGNFSQSYE